MSAAALGLHQARYAIGAGDPAGGHLTSGHSYLTLAIPLLGALSTLAMALFVRRVALGTVSAGPVPMRRTCLLATGCLLAVYVGQECAESLVASWPGGVADAPFGSGGWLALPLAPVFGAVVAFTLRGAKAIGAHLTRRRRTAAGRRPQLKLPRVSAARRPRPTPARHLGARGPPLLPSS